MEKKRRDIICLILLGMLIKGIVFISRDSVSYLPIIITYSLLLLRFPFFNEYFHNKNIGLGSFMLRELFAKDEKKCGISMNE